MTAPAVLRALESGVMRAQGQSLNRTERIAVAKYLSTVPEKAPAPTPASALCSKPAPSADLSAGPTWNGFGAGQSNARFQSAAAAGLNAADVPKLRLKWAFALGDVTSVRGQPVVAGGRLFAESDGNVYSLDPRSGCIYWTFTADGPVRSAVVAAPGPGGRPAVFFGDGISNAYAVDFTTGAMLWQVRLEDHNTASVTDAPAFHDGFLYYGVSSGEEVAGAGPAYECCTFRGSLVALDAATGRTIWKSYTIDKPPAQTGVTKSGVKRFGPSGAGIWSTPTVDTKRNAIYVATGDNYSDPTTNTSDAILAFDRATGKMLWSRQMTAGDAYTVDCSGAVKTNCAESSGPDFDFGQPPILVSLPNGKRALVVGQKSGMAHAIDPDRQGEVLWQTRVGKGGSLGGIQWGSAADARRMYVALSDIGFRLTGDTKPGEVPRMELNPAAGGGLFALDLLTGTKAWSAPPPDCQGRKNCSPAQSGAVSGIPGAVFSGALDAHLRAYSTETGKVVWDIDTAREYDAVNGGKAHGGAIDGGGPAIVGGMVYTYSGYGQWGGVPGNALLAFSVDGK